MQPSPASLISISTKLAERIAQTARFMGLDDVDEQLLWELFVVLGEKTPVAVLMCLKDMAETRPVLVEVARASASIDAKWVRPSGLLRRQGPLVTEIAWVSPEDQMIRYDGVGVDELKDEYAQLTRERAFLEWYDKLQSVREENRTISASSDQVRAEVSLVLIDLYELLQARL